ncbi:MAG: twin-arginine translocase subunit TatC [Terricaulis sp.]
MNKMTDEDEIEASRAPLLEHLVELRNRLMWTIIGVVIGFVACFFFKQEIFLLLTNPFVAAMREAGKGNDIHMINTDAFGFFMTQMKLTLFAALIVSFPMTAYQVYAFIAPGLYKRERAAALPFLVAAPIMFALGAVFVYYVAMPYALEFALSQQVSIPTGNGATIHVDYLPKVDEYIALETTLILAFGLFFQMPVVFSLLSRVGIITAAFLGKTRRYAVVLIAAFAALTAPPDPLSMGIMMIPLYGIFEISILIVWFLERGDKKKSAGEGAAPA